MRRHTITVTERELRAILGALDLAFETGPPWWRTTKYVGALYLRLRGHGIVSQSLRQRADDRARARLRAVGVRVHDA